MVTDIFVVWRVGGRYETRRRTLGELIEDRRGPRSRTRGPLRGPEIGPSFLNDDVATSVRQAPSDKVEEADMESFPASDAPASTLSR